MGRHLAPRGQKSGILLTSLLDGGPTVQQDTVNCRHCGRVWVWMPGSGRVRGWCSRCNGFTCGAVQCDQCQPLEAYLEALEAGKPENWRPIRITTSGLILP